MPQVKLNFKKHKSKKIKKKIGIDLETKSEQVTEENLAPIVDKKPDEVIKAETKVSKTLKVEDKKEDIKKEVSKKESPKKKK